MAWSDVFRRSAAREPDVSLGDAWRLIAADHGLAVEVRGDTSIHATGVFRGRAIDVDIDGEMRGSELLRYARRAGARKPRPRRRWRSQLVVGCVNPRAPEGTICSAVDVDDPAWQPGRYDPAAGRHVTTDPASLAEVVLTGSVVDRLMSIHGDVVIAVEEDALRLSEDRTASKDAGFIGGCVIHSFVGSPPPMPGRAIIGPIWWMDLLCDIADAVEAAP